MSALGPAAPSCSRTVAESSCPLTPPPAGQVWDQQLHPHLQRNQQLQDILLQREEELLQLQEENCKLRQFLSSSFVKNLEVQAKKLTADGRRNLTRELKRNVACTGEGPFQNRHRPPHQQISKRVCRNLTEFRSQWSPEADLDLWVLRMLGLKDCDTIDPSASSSCSSSPACSLKSLLHTSPSNTSLDSWLASSSSSTSTAGGPAKSPQNCSASSGPPSDSTVSGSSRLAEASAAVIMSSCPSAAFQSPPEDPGVRWPSARPGVCSSSCSPAEPAACWWSSLDRKQDSPLAGEVQVSPTSSSSPGIPADPPAVVFSMSLSPSCSVRTHSFPQGQAFVRKNPEGRWNFTWVPRQGP